MTSWATITLKIDKDEMYFTRPPTGLLIDKGNDEYGWVDEERVYALSYGRYQEERYKRHAQDFNSRWFNGVTVGVICSVENTGDNIDAMVLRSKQDGSRRERIDGMEISNTYVGKRFPYEKREDFIELVEDNEGIRPVVEPVETITPPDAIFRL